MNEQTDKPKEEKFNPAQYIELYKRMYSERIASLPQLLDVIAEQELRKATTRNEAFDVLRGLDNVVCELETGDMLKRYLPKVAASKDPKTFRVTYKGDYSTLGDVIRDFRKQAGITQIELAQYSKVSTRTLVKIENQDTNGTVRGPVIDRLLKTFEITPYAGEAAIRKLPLK